MLVRASGSPSAVTRLAAVTGLLHLNTAGGFETLGALVMDEDPGVSQAAVESLVAAGEQVPDGVWLSIANDEDVPTEARVSALEALSKHPDPAYAEMLAGFIFGYDEKVVSLAVDGLVAMGEPSLMYVHPLLDDDDAFHAALRVVRRVADSSSTGRLVKLLDNKHGADRLEVINALGELGTDEAIDALFAEYGSGGQDTDVAVLKAISVSDAAPEDRRVVEIVEAALVSEMETVRFYGAHAAGELGMVSMSKRLADMSEKDPSGLIRRQAGVALGKLSPPEVP